MKHAAIPARRLFTDFEMYASSDVEDDEPDDTEHIDDWHEGQQPPTNAEAEQHVNR